MAQNSQQQRPVSAADSVRKDHQSRVPGLWSSAAVAALSGVVCWIWLMSSTSISMTSEGGGEGVVSELAQVDDQDVTAALTTMGGSTAFLSQFKERTTGCPRPLAWVTLARSPGQPAGTVRLKSGSYYSPVFNLSDVPMRVAIPYPTPYETGQGTLTVMHTGGSATVALLPAWRVPAQGVAATHDVTWHSSNRCQRPNG
jgi:hypothetical protein